MLMGSFHNCESNRSLPLTWFGIEAGIDFGFVKEGEVEDLLFVLPEVEARGTASRWACMRE